MENSPVIIAIEKKEAFLQSPPAGWRRDPSSGKMICEDGSVTVLVADNKFHGNSTTIQVNTPSDLESFKQLVYSKAILSTSLCGKLYSNSSLHRGDESINEQEALTHNEEYIVLINVRHPQVQQMFNQAIQTAHRLLSQGKKFRVSISFSESIKTWFIQSVHMPNENNSTAWARGCDIYLVNGVSEPGFADNCFSCEANTMKAFWCVCFPFFFLLFLPYLIYKKCILGLAEEDIKQAFPVTFHNGPFQMGFNLLNLLYPPGTVVTTVTSYQQPIQQQPTYPQHYQQQTYQ